MKIEVLAEGLDFSEGPAFTPDGELWCVELKGGNLVRWNEQGHARFAPSIRQRGNSKPWWMRLTGSRCTSRMTWRSMRAAICSLPAPAIRDTRRRATSAVYRPAAN